MSENRNIQNHQLMVEGIQLRMETLESELRHWAEMLESLVKREYFFSEKIYTPYQPDKEEETGKSQGLEN